MPAPGWPSQNPARNRPNTIRTPVNGSLMEWLSWNFPDVFKKVSQVRRDSIRDYKSADYARQHPTMTGRVP